MLQILVEPLGTGDITAPTVQNALVPVIEAGLVLIQEPCEVRAKELPCLVTGQGADAAALISAPIRPS